MFGRKSVEKGVPEELKRQNHLLEDYFDAFEDETGKIGVMFVIIILHGLIFSQVFCSDVPGLIERVVLERGLSVETTDIHIGMDGGAHLERIKI